MKLLDFIKTHRQLIFNILKIVVSIIMLTIIFRSLDLAAFANLILNAHLGWLSAAIFSTILIVVLRSIRWQILLKSVEIKVPIYEVTTIILIGMLFNNLLPSGLGGDAIRAVEMNRHSKRGSDTVTSLVVERFTGLSALQAIAVVALLTDWDAVPTIVAYFTVAIFLAGLLIGSLLINQRLYQWLRKNISLFRRIVDIEMVGNLFESFQRYPLSAVGKAYLVSFLFNLTLIANYLFIGLALGSQARLIHYAIFVPITSIVLLLPISFAGLGVRESVYSQLFAQVGVPSEVSVAISLLVYAFNNIFTGLLGGILYLSRSVKGIVSTEEVK